MRLFGFFFFFLPGRIRRSYSDVDRVKKMENGEGKAVENERNVLLYKSTRKEEPLGYWDESDRE